MTAVEWLENILKQSCGKEFTEGYKELFDKAKEMEKQHVIDAWYDGQNDFEREVDMYAFGENYYKEKFKSEENGK